MSWRDADLHLFQWRLDNCKHTCQICTLCGVIRCCLPQQRRGATRPQGPVQVLCWSELLWVNPTQHKQACDVCSLCGVIFLFAAADGEAWPRALVHVQVLC